MIELNSKAYFCMTPVWCLCDHYLWLPIERSGCGYMTYIFDIYTLLRGLSHVIVLWNNLFTPNKKFTQEHFTSWIIGYNNYIHEFNLRFWILWVILIYSNLLILYNTYLLITYYNYYNYLYRLYLLVAN